MKSPEFTRGQKNATLRLEAGNHNHKQPQLKQTVQPRHFVPTAKDATTNPPWPPLVQARMGLELVIVKPFQCWEWRWWSMVMVMMTMINDNIHDHHRWCHFIHDNMIVMMIADDQWWSMTINDDQWSMIINDIQSTMLNGDQWRWLSNDHQFESLLRSVIVLGVCWVFFNDGGETNEPNSTTSWPTHVPTTWLPLLK